jgi:hypothetical protein
MSVKASLMFGFPFETRRDMWKSIRFGMTLARNGVRDVYAYPFCPYPGSELTDELRQQGALPPMGNEYFAAVAVQNWGQNIRVNKNVFGWEIVAYQVIAMLSAQAVVYANEPMRFLRTIRGTLSGNYGARGSMIDRVLAGILPAGLVGLPRQVGTRLRHALRRELQTAN